MDYSEKANIVALVKLLGSPLSSREILELYSQYYQEAKAELTKSEKSAEVNLVIAHGNQTKSQRIINYRFVIAPNLSRALSLPRGF